MSTEDENDGVIPVEDFRAAIDACCRDPEMRRRYEDASAGARLYIALGFYARFQGAALDISKYQTCLADIEPDLTPADVDYLIATETDGASLRYLHELWGRMAPGRPLPRPATPDARAVPMKLKRVEDVQRERRAAEDASELDDLDTVSHSSLERELTRTGPLLKWILLGVAVVGLVVACCLLVHDMISSPEGKPEPGRVAGAAVSDARTRELKTRIAKLEQERASIMERHEKEVAALGEASEARIAVLKKELEAGQAAVREREKSVERLEAEGRRLSRDAAIVIGRLEDRIKSGKKSAQVLAEQGRAGTVVDKACSQCRGAGRVTKSRTCPTCFGDGRGPYRRWGATRTNCTNCRGSGRISEKHTCPLCSGKGRVPLDR